MVRIIWSRVIRASREQVFQYSTDGINWVRWFPDHFLSWEVLSHEDKGRITETEERWLGRRFKHVDSEVITAPEKVEAKVIRGRGKGSKFTYVLKEVPEGTRMELVFEPKGVSASLLVRLFRKRMESEVDNVLDTFVKNIEAAQQRQN